MWKAAAVFLRIVIVLGVGLLGLELARQAYFYPNIPAAEYPPPANRAEAWQQDLDYLRTYVAQVTIIGTEMGDYARMWGETSLLTLPNSQLDLQLATGLHDYKDGCYAFPDCYWLDFFMNVSVESLAPEVTIPFAFADYARGEDAAMNYILQTEQVLTTIPSSVEPLADEIHP